MKLIILVLLMPIMVPIVFVMNLAPTHIAELWDITAILFYVISALSLFSVYAYARKKQYLEAFVMWMVPGATFIFIVTLRYPAYLP